MAGPPSHVPSLPTALAGQKTAQGPPSPPPPPRLVRRAPPGFQRPVQTQKKATPLQKRTYLMAHTTTPAVTGAICGQTMNGGRAAVACSTSRRDFSSASGMEKLRFVSTVD